MKYIAEIRGAREVTLVAAADLEFWRDHLREEGLIPEAVNGRAEVWISSVASRWMGISQRELSVSLAVAGAEGESPAKAFYLVAAFNSSRLFAWCERALLKTPYQHAQVQVSPQPIPHCTVRHGEQLLLRAERREAGGPEQVQDDVWEGAIFLPTDGQRPGQQRRFHARLSGLTECHPFCRGDVLSVTPSRKHLWTAWLIESQVSGVQWRIRPAAVHARSKTLVTTR